MAQNEIFIQCLESIQPYRNVIQKSGRIDLINALDTIEHKLMLGYENTTDKDEEDRVNIQELLLTLQRQLVTLTKLVQDYVKQHKPEAEEEPTNYPYPNVKKSEDTGIISKLTVVNQ